MTTRERISKTRGRSVLIALTGFLIAFSAVIAQDTHREFATALFFVGFALFGGAIIYAILTGRCVHCGQRISILLSKDSDAILVPQEMRFCPYCGKSLDEDARKMSAPLTTLFTHAVRHAGEHSVGDAG